MPACCRGLLNAALRFAHWLLPQAGFVALWQLYAAAADVDPLQQTDAHDMTVHPQQFLQDNSRRALQNLKSVVLQLQNALASLASNETSFMSSFDRRLPGPKLCAV
jgi:hypothetical protein